MIINPHYIYFDDFPEGPTEYLTFSSANEFSINSTGRYWDGTLYYSTNKLVWLEWDGSEIYSNNGYLYIAGINNTYISSTYSVYSRFNITSYDGSLINCSGNIETLLDWRDVRDGNHPTMGDGAFQGLFKNCSYLGSAPSLPATTLTRQCYHEMFYGCFSLKVAPSLPATDLIFGCYFGMFQNCFSLTTVPSFTIGDTVSCSEYMFKGCSSIKVSNTKTGAYQNTLVINNGWSYQDAMFEGTSGTWNGDCKSRTTYYTSNPVV